jgi:PadR family transcriptional regulator PadR
MQCEEIWKKGTEYANGELQGPARSEFEQHPRECDACRAEAAGLKRLCNDLEALARFDRVFELYKLGRELGPFEQKVLAAILTLTPEPGSSAIHDRLCGITGTRVNLDTLYAVLDRLEEKGLLQSRQSDADNSLRGQPKRLYRMEAAGFRALQESLESAKRLSELFEENSGSAQRWITNAAAKGPQSL